MAKSDAFFIRATVDFNGTTYADSAIDLGSYVDALGKSVLRIHNLVVQWGNPLEDADGAGAVDCVNAFQLTTQRQTSMVGLTDRSVIATGKLQAGEQAGGTTLNYISETLDVAPQHWSKGYLVGVEQIYLGVQSNNAAANGLTGCSIMMECTVETLSQSAAMALALSQQ